MADIPIPAKQAHDALQMMLDRLAMANKKKLEPRKLGKGAKSTNVDEWEQALRTAMLEIEEWCPGFSMVLPPK